MSPPTQYRLYGKRFLQVKSFPEGEQRWCCGDIDRWVVPCASAGDKEGATSNSRQSDGRNE